MRIPFALHRALRSMLWAGTLSVCQLCASGVAASRDLAGDDDLYAAPTTRDHVGRVLLPVMINGLGPFKFIVDTGADHSTISAPLMRRLALSARSGTAVILNGITGSAQVPAVSIDSFEAGNLHLGPADMPVLFTPIAAGADGILGAAGLTDSKLLVDFQRNRVAIARRGERMSSDTVVKIRGTRLTHGLMSFTARIGRTAVRVIIDTGAERTLGNPALAQALHARDERGSTARITTVYGATEEVETGRIEIVPPLVVDVLRITDVAVVFGDFHIFKVWDLQSQPALILGMDVLGTVASLSIDFGSREIGFGSVAPHSDLLSNMRAYVTAQPGQRR